MPKPSSPTQAQTREINAVCDAVAQALGLQPEDVWYRWVTSGEYELTLTAAQAKEILRRAGIKVGRGKAS